MPSTCPPSSEPTLKFPKTDASFRVLEGAYHADGGADDAELDDNDGWLDLGPEDRAEKEIVLKQMPSPESPGKGTPRGREHPPLRSYSASTMTSSS